MNTVFIATNKKRSRTQKKTEKTKENKRKQ